MTKDEWRKREAQWAKFHQWESQQPPPSLSPSASVAEVGWLADLALERRRPGDEPARDMAEHVAGMTLMRRRLAVLSRAA